MKQNIFLLLIYASCLISCHPQDKAQTNIEYEARQQSISLILYPSGNADDVRYLISIIGDSLVVDSYYPGRELKKRKKIFLSKNQTMELEALAASIKTGYRNSYLMDDAWGVTLTINGEVVYEDSDFSLGRTFNEGNTLINYIVGLSPIKIELYGFS